MTKIVNTNQIPHPATGEASAEQVIELAGRVMTGDVALSELSNKEVALVARLLHAAPAFKWISIRMVWLWFGISPRVQQRLRSNGSLKYAIVNQRVLYRQCDIVQWLEQNVKNNKSLTSNSLNHEHKENK